MRIGIVGAGQIVPSFLDAAVLNDKIKIESICAVGMGDRLKELQEKYNISKSFEDYDIMLENISVDTIYVAVPNHLHYLMAKKALERGLNVILEKPFTITLEEAMNLFELAEEKNVFIFEAITTMHSPNYHKARELIQNMPVVKIAYLNYTQYSSRYDAFKAGEILPAFDYKKAGGALRDINIYNIHFAVGIFGKPKNVKYYPNIVRNVDVSGTLILDYKDFSCILVGSKDCSNNAEIRIQGDKQTLLSYSPANVFANFKWINDTEVTDYDLLDTKERLYYELVEFERVIRENDQEAMEKYKEHTLDVMEVVEKAFKSLKD